jgi:hypothetical protein
MYKRRKLVGMTNLFVSPAGLRLQLESGLTDFDEISYVYDAIRGHSIFTVSINLFCW